MRIALQQAVDSLSVIRGRLQEPATEGQRSAVTELDRVIAQGREALAVSLADWQVCAVENKNGNGCGLTWLGPWTDCPGCTASEAALALSEALATATTGWQPMDTMPERGQVLVCWSTDQFDTIGLEEYEEIIDLGETPAKGWMRIPAPPSAAESGTPT